MEFEKSVGRSRTLPIAALVVAILLLPVSLAIAADQLASSRQALDSSLRNKAEERATVLNGYFQRAAAIDLLTAHNPAFREFYEQPGDRLAKVAAGGPLITEANRALDYLETLFPESIGEACFIDAAGPENARMVRGERAPLEDLSPDESEAVFFTPAFALDQGQVYQSEPYVSPDTEEWVISNSTPVPTGDGVNHAIVHFEVTIESFRREAAATSEDFDVVVVDRGTGAVIIDSGKPQRVGAPLGHPGNARFAGGGLASDDGVLTLDGRRAAYKGVATSDTNANDWIVVATSSTAPASALGSIGVAPVGMVAIALLLLAFAALNLGASGRALRQAALTDGLTGLGNRRKLNEDLDRRLDGERTEPTLMAVYDLNGFKPYNDTFGHPAGDALLTRLGRKLAAEAAAYGDAYRMGGDEFCVLASLEGRSVEGVLAGTLVALSEEGDGFSITSSCGWVVLPEEVTQAVDALQLADERMYLQKASRLDRGARQSSEMLTSIQRERDQELAEHLRATASLAAAIGARVGLAGSEVETIRHAAELRDIGKVALPDAIAKKQTVDDPAELAFLQRHPHIGASIISTMPSLGEAARLVRSSYEQYDGKGYPDGLAGEQIPLGARIIAVCEQYEKLVNAMGLPPEEAAAELQRSAGTAFDPDLVAVVAAAVREGAIAAR